MTPDELSRLADDQAKRIEALKQILRNIRHECQYGEASFSEIAERCSEGLNM